MSHIVESCLLVKLDGRLKKLPYSLLITNLWTGLAEFLRHVIAYTNNNIVWTRFVNRFWSKDMKLELFHYWWLNCHDWLLICDLNWRQAILSCNALVVGGLCMQWTLWEWRKWPFGDWWQRQSLSSSDLLYASLLCGSWTQCLVWGPDHWVDAHLVWCLLPCSPRQHLNFIAHDSWQK